MQDFLLPTLLIVISMAVYMVYGLKKSGDLRVEDFAVNGRRTSSYALVTSLLASLVGGWMFLGLNAIAFEAGTAALAIGLGYVLGIGLLLAYSNKIVSALSSSGSYTLDSYLGQRFGKHVHAMVVALNFIFFIAVLAAQFLAFRSVSLLFFPTWADITGVLIALAVISYTSVSGYVGVLVTDRIQVFVIAAALMVISAVLLFTSPPISIASIPTQYFYGTEYGITFLIGALFFFPFTMLVRTDLWQRFASSGSSDDINKALRIVAVVLLPLYVIITMLAYRTKLAGFIPQTPETSTLEFFFSLVVNLPGGGLLFAITVAGFVAALVSTIDTNLNVVSVAVAKYMSSPGGTGERVGHDDIRNYRATTLVIGCLGLLASYLGAGIVDLIVGAASILLVLLPLTIYSLHSEQLATPRRKNLIATSLLFGFAVLAYFFIFISTTIAFIPAVGASALGLLVAVASSPNKTTEEEG